jgi:hypothetical protein
MSTKTKIDPTQTFWDIVAIKDSIDGIMNTIEDDRDAYLESMVKVDLHNAKVELNAALGKLHLLIQTTD